MTTIDIRKSRLNEIFDSFLSSTNAYTVGKDVDLVYPNLYVGTRDFANDGNNLKTFGITHALNVCDDSIRTNRKMFDDLNIVFAHVSFQNVENLQEPQTNCLSLLSLSSAFVREAIGSGGKILIYSILGVNQAPAVVIAYFIETFILSVERSSLALAFKRLVKPSDYILEQLIRLSDCVLDKKLNRIAESVATSERLQKVLNLLNGVDVVRHLFYPKSDVRMIQFNLFVGSETFANSFEEIHQNGITHVLNLCEENVNPSMYDRMEIGLTIIETTRDFSFDMDSLVEMCVALITDRLKCGERVLVNGKESRSLVFTVVTAYFMKSYNISLDMALIEITKRRRVYLGVKYLLFLLNYEKKLQKRNQTVVDDPFYMPYCRRSKPLNSHALTHRHLTPPDCNPMTIRYYMETSV